MNLSAKYFIFCLVILLFAFNISVNAQCTEFDFGKGFNDQMKKFPGFSIVVMWPLNNPDKLAPTLLFYNLLENNFEEQINKINKRRTLNFYCANTIQNKNAFDKLLKCNFTQCANKDSTFVNWERKGIPDKK